MSVLAVFGSAVTTDAAAQPPRDLDVAVGFRRGGDGDLFTFIARLNDLIGPANIDPLNLDAADPVARAEALSGTPLYEAAPGLFAEQSVRPPPGAVRTPGRRSRRHREVRR